MSMQEASSDDGAAAAAGSSVENTGEDQVRN